MPLADKADALEKKVQQGIPAGGKVDVLTVTDKQFSDMKRYYSQKSIKTMKSQQCKQLHLF